MAGGQGPNKKNRPGQKKIQNRTKRARHGPERLGNAANRILPAERASQVELRPRSGPILEKTASEEKYFSDRPAMLALFPENRRMTISSHRPGKAKSVQPVGFVLASYIGRTQFHVTWSRERPNSSYSCFLRCPEGGFRPMGPGPCFLLRRTFFEICTWKNGHAPAPNLGPGPKIWAQAGAGAGAGPFV